MLSFLGGKKREDGTRKLEQQNKELQSQLKEAQEELGGIKASVQLLQSNNKKLQTTNQALNSRVHRLELQREKLEQDNMQLTRKPWIAEGLLENATVKQENEKLKRTLKTQGKQFEDKVALYKSRTKKLIAAILHPSQSAAARHQTRAGAPATAIEGTGEEGLTLSLDDGAPLSMAEDESASADGESVLGLEFDDPAVQASVLEIVSSLYDDSMSEDDAVQKLAKLQCALTLTLSRATSHGDLLSLASPASMRPAGHDASTSPLRVRHGAGFDGIGAQQGDEAAGDGSPTKGQLPKLNMAALAALVGEELSAPGSPGAASNRSYGSLRSNATNSDSFMYLTQFVLAQPEKLQRLISRATAAHAGASGRHADGCDASAPGMGAMPPLQLPNGMPGMGGMQGASRGNGGGLGRLSLSNQPTAPTTAPTQLSSGHDDTRPSSDKPRVTHMQPVNNASKAAPAGNIPALKFVNKAAGRVGGGLAISGKMDQAAAGSGTMMQTLGALMPTTNNKGDQMSGGRGSKSTALSFKAMGAAMPSGAMGGDDDILPMGSSSMALFKR